jgi:hypothetical protein
MSSGVCGTVAVGLLLGAAAVGQAQEPEHVVVYYESGRFAGHPANGGIWSWGDETLVGFRLWHFMDTSRDAVRAHARDPKKGSLWRFARSLDGGITWKMEVPTFSTGTGQEPPPTESPGGFDFTHPDAAVQFRSSHFFYSNDRGRTWQGPYQLPEFGHPRIMARTDYIVDGPHELRAFLTVAKVNKDEGRVICVRTTDGGKSWTLLGHVGPEPEGFSIMSSSERLSPQRILTTIRRKEGERHWIDAWVTDDNGLTWKWFNRPVPSTGGAVGNSPALLKLRDGRLALAYGYRSRPYGIRIRFSSDLGRTWGHDIVLRADGGNWDLGYPMMVQRPDGKLVIVYYFNFLYDWEKDGPHPGPAAPGREPHIAATIWDPSPRAPVVSRSRVVPR